LPFSLRRYWLRDSSEVLEAVNARIVTVSPIQLKRVSTDKLKSGKVKTVFGITYIWTHDISQHVRFSAAGRAWAGPAQKLEIEVRFSVVVPENRQFIANLLNVRWFQAHRDRKFTTTLTLRAIFRPQIYTDETQIGITSAFLL
jgi:hypothetical protein